MSGGSRTRLWTELGLAVLSISLFVATLVLPDWIEVVFGIDPDRGSGALEVLISVVSLTGTLGFALLAHLEWRRLQTDHN